MVGLLFWLSNDKLTRYLEGNVVTLLPPIPPDNLIRCTNDNLLNGGKDKA